MEIMFVVIGLCIICFVILQTKNSSITTREIPISKRPAKRLKGQQGSSVTVGDMFMLDCLGVVDALNEMYEYTFLVEHGSHFMFNYKVTGYSISFTDSITLWSSNDYSWLDCTEDIENINLRKELLQFCVKAFLDSCRSRGFKL